MVLLDAGPAEPCSLANRDHFENLNGAEFPYLGGEILTRANGEVAQHLPLLSILLGD